MTATGDATGVTVEDALPSGYTLVPGSISNGGSYGVGSGIISWSGLTMANGTDTGSLLTYQATVNATGSYVNVAEITASDLPDPNSTPDNGILAEDDQDDATFTIATNIPPVADNETSTGNNQGTTVSQNIITGDTDSDGTIDPMSVNLIVPSGGGITTSNPVTDLNGDLIGFAVDGEGVWLYNEVTGVVSFDPIPGFTGDPTPISYTIDDDDGATSNIATIAVEYIAIPPVVVDDQDLDNVLGDTVGIMVLGNDALGDGTVPDPTAIIFALTVPPAAMGTEVIGANGTVIGFTAPGEGVWLYNEASGVLEFDPDPTFEGDPTPVDYNTTDVDTGEVSAAPATVTITYQDRPVAVNDQSLGNTSGSTVTLDIVGNDTDGDGNLDPTTVSLTTPVGATNVVTSTDGDSIGFEVPGEGVWSYDETTGAITFDPEDGFTGDPTDIAYTIFDEDGNESTNPAMINIEYLDTPPVAENDVNPVPTAIGDPTVITILTNDVLPDGTTPDLADVSIDLDPSTPGIDTMISVPGGRHLGI